MEQNLTYESAYHELETIYDEINNEEVSIDLLAEKVKRAAFLIEYCQAKLRSTEEEIGKIISSLPQAGATVAKDMAPESNNYGGDDELPF